MSCKWLAERLLSLGDDANLLLCAAFGGHVEAVQWLHRQQCPITRVAADVALKHPAVLDWLLSQGMPEVETLCRTAIRRGELLGLQVLQTRGLPAQLDQPIDLSQPSENPAAHGDLLVVQLVVAIPLHCSAGQSKGQAGPCSQA